MIDNEIQEFIKNQINAHMTNDYSHKVANENRNGFMSAEQAKILDELKKDKELANVQSIEKIQDEKKQIKIKKRYLHTNIPLQYINSSDNILKIDFNKDSDTIIYPEANKLDLPLIYKRSPYGRMVNFCNEDKQSLLIDLKENLGIFNLSFILDTYDMCNTERECSSLVFTNENKDLAIMLNISNKNMYISYIKDDKEKSIPIDEQMLTRIFTGNRYKAISLIKEDNVLSLYVDEELVSKIDNLELMVPVRYFYLINCPSIVNLTIDRSTTPYPLGLYPINVHEYFGDKEYSTVKMRVQAIKYKDKNNFSFDKNTDIDITPIISNQKILGIIINTGSYIKNSKYADGNEYLNDTNIDIWQDNVKYDTIYNVVDKNQELYKAYKDENIVNGSILLDKQFEKGTELGLANLYIPFDIDIKNDSGKIEIYNMSFNRYSSNYQILFDPIPSDEELVVNLSYTEVVEKNRSINKGTIDKAILDNKITMEEVKEFNISPDHLCIIYNDKVIIEKNKPLLMQRDDISLEFRLRIPVEFKIFMSNPQLSKYIKVQLNMKICTDKDNQIIQTNEKSSFNMKAGAVTLKDFMIYDEASELFTYKIDTKNKLLVDKFEVKLIFDCDTILINKENDIIKDMICYKDGLLDIMTDKLVEITYLEEEGEKDDSSY